jgi:5'-3' exonuclease
MLLLVDYSSLLYRAFHSVPPSVPANGVYGFLSMLARLVADRRPSALVVALDEDWRPDFRVAALPSYKAHRVAAPGDEPDPVAPQEALGREVLRALGICIAGADGFEAEDVIATLAARARGPVEIASGDRDLFALVRDPDVKVLYPVRGVSTLVEVDEAEIERRYGIPGRGYGDFALLRGDPSDGLPGVPGIGEKTAAALLARYGTLDALLAATDLAPALARRLEGGRDYLAAARRVVLPVADVPLPRLDLSLPERPAQPRVLARLIAEHGLAGPVSRLQRALAQREAPPRDALKVPAARASGSSRDGSPGRRRGADRR